MIATGAINSDSVVYWAAEAAANFGPFYVAAGYFDYQINRRQTTLEDFNFHGWLAQASWIITGEARGWNGQNAAYQAPKPAKPFDLEGEGWGAWELAGRYTLVDLNDREGAAGSPMPLDGVRGGEQEIWTLGLNWYPNSVVRFALDYQYIDIDRISTSAAVPGIPGLYPQIGQTIQAVSLRSQISL
jgi:phosphate-selective porin OprO/OprP